MYPVLMLPVHDKGDRNGHRDRHDADDRQNNEENWHAARIAFIFKRCSALAVDICCAFGALAAAVSQEAEKREARALASCLDAGAMARACLETASVKGGFEQFSHTCQSIQKKG